MFRQINSLVTHLVTLLSRNFCQKCMRENSRNFCETLEYAENEVPYNPHYDIVTLSRKN